MRIIPAIDLIDGQCVRLTQGDYQQKKTYNENPLEVAKTFESAGIKHLHLVDLDGARHGAIKNLKVLEQITSHTHLKVDFGGGIRTDQDISRAFDAGASQINLGSVALEHKTLFAQWLEAYGADRIILSADVKDKKIAIHGWQQASEVDLFDLMEEYQALGNRYVTCTDISQDGTLQGLAIARYTELAQAFPKQKIIASGGVKDTTDLDAAAAIGLEGVIIGKAIYENSISLQQLQAYAH